MPIRCSTLSAFPFWWIDTAFGKLVFVLFFVTWGLVVVALALHILYLVRKLFARGK